MDASGQSRTIPVVTMAVMAVVLASALSGYLFGFIGPEESDPPMISQTTGEIEVQDDGQIVRITHVSGDVATVSELELVVDATDACGEQARLLNLPTTTSESPTVEGSDIFGIGSGGAPSVRVPSDGKWDAGTSLGLVIDAEECRIEPDESVAVTVVHRPSGTVIIDERFGR